MTKKVSESLYGNKIAERIRAIEGGSPGSLAADFSVVDIKGESLKLSAFRGKNFVLLDFWATWCKPCRENNPFLIKIYELYNSKGLEIISIANDDTRSDAWRQAVQKDNMRWLNVLQGVGTSNDIGKKYAVQPIPAYILIDKQGRIILRYEGEQNEMLLAVLNKIWLN